MTEREKANLDAVTEQLRRWLDGTEPMPSHIERLRKIAELSGFEVTGHTGGDGWDTLTVKPRPAD